MSEKEKFLSALKKPGAIRFPCNESLVTGFEDQFSKLKSVQIEGATYWHENDKPGVANTRIKIYPTGHMAFYNREGRRFLTSDPGGEPLNECEWVTDETSGQTRLAHARMQLDCQQWIGIKPRAKTFSTQIDIKGQPGWETISLDDLRGKAAEAWRVPVSEVKYFYSDENMVPKGDGKYDIRLTKDGLYALNDGEFDKTLFISFMFAVNWARLDLIPVVELFQSTLPGSGGATFELIWGLYEDQSREQDLGPLRYRGLPTYPSKEAFNIFSAFFTPKGPEGKDIMKVFMDADRSHQITWTPKPNPPWRYFSHNHKLTLTVQDKFLFKVTAHDDALAIPFVNCARGAKPSCQRELQVKQGSFILIDGDLGREIPFETQWGIEPRVEPLKPLAKSPFGWKWFFNNFPPTVDPVKILYTVPFYPEGAADIDEAALQPMVLDQMFYYLEMSPGMPKKLEKIDKVLIHTFDTVIAGCIDCTHPRQYTVLFSDPEFAQKNACLLWNYGASRNQLDNLSKVSFLPERENVVDVYKEKYGLIFKWIPFIYFQDREACQSMLQSAVEALEPEGILFLVGPKPIQGLFEHFSLDCLYNDPVINMPFYRQHLKMCPENQVNPELTVFLVEKKQVKKEEPPPLPPVEIDQDLPQPDLRGFRRN
ncbi:MAG: hypothetical protein NPINA01_21660 [Nitrospinaceae bacterium]|nr:MAG: hypothetical protein NPINA01_21660 [Nitrospinaceae bacterium]